MFIHQTPMCSSCNAGCTHFAYGRGNYKNAKYFFIFDQPGITDCGKGKIGKGIKGTLLLNTLKEVGIPLKECYFSSLVWCRQEDKPSAESIASCSNRLHHEIDTIQPQYLILMGSTVVSHFFSNKNLFKDRFERLEWKGIPAFIVNDMGFHLNDPESWIELYESLEELIHPLPKLDEEWLKSYTFLEREGQVLEALNSFVDGDSLTLDIETNHVYPYGQNKNIRLIGIGNLENVYEFTLITDTILDALEALSRRTHIVAHEANMEYSWFKKLYNRDIIISVDTLLYHHFLEERKCRRRLKLLGNRYLGIRDWSDVMEETDEYDITNAPLNILEPYLAVDIRAPLLLLDKWKKTRESIPDLLNQLLHKGRRALTKLSCNGLKVDQHDLLMLYYELDIMVDPSIDFLKSCSERLDFNPESPIQIGHLLFDELGYERINDNSTGKEVIAELISRYPKDTVLNAIKEVREIRKAQSASVNAFYKYSILYDGYIHPTFKMTTETGRLSAKDPNTQQIPSRGKLSTAIRNCFKLPDDTWEFWQADYSQIEVFMAAIMTGDENLLHVLTKGDIYKEMASIFLRKPVSEITKEERQNAKPTVLGTQFDRSAYAIAKEYKIPLEVATNNQRAYFKNFPKIKENIDTALDKINDPKWGKETPYVSTMFGRRRRFPLRLGGYHQLNTKRTIINAPIQGSATDFCLWALISLWDYIDTNHWEDWIRPTEIVHDSIGGIWKKNRREEGIELINKCMLTTPIPLPVPLRIEIKTGDKWGELK